MRPFASRLLRTRRRRVGLGVAIAFTSLLGALPVGRAPAVVTGGDCSAPAPSLASPLPDVPIPDLPSTADLDSLLQMLPAGVDLDGLDLTKGEDLKKLLASLPANVIDTTFNLTDTPGSWFDSGLQLFGGTSLSVMEILPGVKNKVKFVVGSRHRHADGALGDVADPSCGRGEHRPGVGLRRRAGVRDHRAGPLRLHLQDPPVHARGDRGRRPAHRWASTSATSRS